MGNSVKGTRLKLNVFMKKLDGFTLRDVDFNVEVFTDRGGYAKFEKADTIEVDENNYKIPIDTAKIGAGRYSVRLTAYIPDGDFPDGIRIEKKTFHTKEIIDTK